MSIRLRLKQLERTAGNGRCIHHAQVVADVAAAASALCPHCAQRVPVVIVPEKLTFEEWAERAASWSMRGKGNEHTEQS